MPYSSDDDDEEERRLQQRQRSRYEEDDEDTQDRRQRPRRTTEDDDDGDIIIDGNVVGGEQIDDDRTQRIDNTARAPHARAPHPTPPTPTPLQVHTNVWGINASLTRAYPHGFPPELVAEELRVQTEVGGNAANIASFRIETLQQQTLTAFGFLQHKDMTIHIMHSPATYYARGAIGPLKGKDIGFVGDRTEFSTPAPIVLQPVKPWKWLTLKTVISDVAVELFYANPNNANKFFIPSQTDTIDKITVPLLIMLPSSLLQFCAAQPRTPLDLLRQVTKLMMIMIPSPDTPGAFVLPDFDLVLNWCYAALLNDKGDSALSYDVQAAVGNDVFHRWARARIDATIGSTLFLHQPAHGPLPPNNPPPQPAQPQAAQDLSHFAVLAAEFGKGVMAAIQPGAGTALGSQQTVQDKREYDAYQKAMLQGFAHTPSPAGLPHIWYLFCQTKSLDTHRLHLREAMQLWARNSGVSINRGVFLSKIAVDDIVNLRFNPGGSAAYYSTAEKGISILLCRSRPGEDREAARQQELAEELSANNRSLSEAITLTKSAPRAPPDTYNDLKIAVGTFCAFIWALFGDSCEYFQKLYELYLCLDGDRACEDWANFTPLLCRQITWAIIDDGREYFSQTMLPERFSVPPGTPIRYPRSSLEELIRPIKTQAPILRANFPTQWLPRSDFGDGTNTIARQLVSAATGYNSVFGTPSPLATVVTGNRTNRSGASSVASSITAPTVNTARSQAPRQREIRADNIHPKIKNLLAPFFHKFGQLQLTRVMMLASVTWPEMPTIAKYMAGTTNKLCYNYVLGRCTSRYCTHRAGHAPIADVPETFASEIINCLKPGVDKMTEAMMLAPWPEFQNIIAARNLPTPSA